MRFPLAALLFAAPALFVQPFLLDQGAAAYSGDRYAEAVTLLEKAVRATPSDAQARFYLGNALLSQYIPGADTPENRELARRAESELQIATGLQPDHLGAMRSMAALYHLRSMTPLEADRLHYIDQATYWLNRILSVKPDDKEAHHQLGVCAWLKAYARRLAARRQLGMRPEDPGPLSDPGVRASVRSDSGQTIAEGIRHVERALELDPGYDDAMAYLNLLYRERADLNDSPEAYRTDIALADTWVQRALDIKRSKASETAGSTAPDIERFTIARPAVRVPPPPAPPGGAIGGIIGAAPVPAPGTTGERPAMPNQIRVGGNVQARKLVNKPEAACPPLAMQARIQGMVASTP